MTGRHGKSGRGKESACEGRAYWRRPYWSLPRSEAVDFPGGHIALDRGRGPGPRRVRRVDALVIATATDTHANLRDVGAGLGVLNVVGDDPSYDTRLRLHRAQWLQVVETFDAIQEIARAYGLRTALHPHFGAFVESAEDARRLTDDSELDLCLDTGHLALAGHDPVAFESRAPGRIRHVHLKDIDPSEAAAGLLL